jgi:acyl-CoA reductase-like NAD-dependent aldehyde dehydrogenase
MIDQAAADRVMAWILQAKKRGARVLCGGKARGMAVQPTVLCDVPLDEPLVCQEAFGPVLVVHRYRRRAQVYRRLSNFRFGLQASIYTASQGVAFEAFEALRMGSVMVNEIPTFRLDTMPYGGSKDSGLGREGVRFAMAHYCEQKNLIINAAY